MTDSDDGDRIIIWVAHGIIMTGLHCDEDTAMRLLCKHALTHGIDLATAARDVIDDQRPPEQP